MTTHPLVQQLLQPDAPLALRLAAVQGTLPVSQAELLSVIVRLSSDPEEEVREGARASIAAIGPEDLGMILADPATEGGVIEHLLDFLPLSSENLLAALANPSVSDAALCRMASSDRGEAIEHLARNQERLLSCPAILERLEANPHAGADLAGLLADFREQFFPEGIPSSAVEEGDLGTAVSEEGDVVTEEELQRLLAEVGDLPFLSVEMGDLIDSQGMSADLNDLIKDDAALESVWKRLSRLAGPARLKEALRGGKEVRTILVRDHNRVIACAVLKNPRLTESEVEGLATSRSLHQDVLRMIGQSREWMRSYSILHRLVRNPKTPSGIAMNYVGRLITRDMQAISRDHNVPEIIRRLARRHMDVRERKAAGPVFKRH